MEREYGRSMRQDRGRAAKERKSYNRYYREYLRQTCQELISGEKEYVRVSPFAGPWLADNWRRVTDPSELPVASRGATRQVLKYDHFIFGYTGSWMLVGVPGKHSEEDWPDRGRSGFVLWQPVKGSKEYGYWCLVIDYKAGIITEIS